MKNSHKHVYLVKDSVCERTFIYTQLCACMLSHIQLFVTPWTVARQASLSMGFPRQECWNGLPFPSPGDLPDPGIEPASPALAGECFSTVPPGHLRMHV